MTEPEFVVRRPRPTKLSDPHHDSTPQFLAELLATPDERLDGVDFRNLFGPTLPAGTYGEIAYFLPSALAYLGREDDGVGEALPAVVGWISDHADELAHEGLLAPARANLRSLLDRWTREFVVIHFDRTACRAKGWGIRHFDAVAYSEAVTGLVEELIRFHTQADLAEGFIAELARHEGDAIKAAWLLECARSCSDRTFRVGKGRPILKLITGRVLLEEAAKVVMDRLVPNETSPTYWIDTFNALGVRP